MTTPPAQRQPNRLLAETSPYLQQHAHNPVDWYPWGDEALQRAKDLDRPIFLSVGYSSCHWCHVMERESFEDEEIARLMNEHFVNIKVDREERPDLDSIYMSAVQIMTGSGGWPMSVFLTPELKPFWGGTYFPPTGRLGRPGFRHILSQIATAYRDDRPKVEEAASTLTGYLVDAEAGGGSEPESELPGEEVLFAAVQHAVRTFDSAHGGFGPAPKFPRSIEISGLLRHHARTGDSHVLLLCEKTLESMALGGIYDQDGGGFHRYSTDAVWLVPHFEKMLYDNALLARAYLEAYQATGRELYQRIAREVLDYVLREMTDDSGGFYSATDADSEGEEGKFFVWTPGQVIQELGADDGRAFCELYGVTEGGNFEHGTSIPHVARSVEAVARGLGVAPADLERRLPGMRARLLAARESRVKPFRDEKVITAWNGLMISALARGYQMLEEPRYLDAAKKAASLLGSELEREGKLHRTRKAGKAQVPGYLDDYSYLADALIDVYEATFDPVWLARARLLTDALLESFWDVRDGGFFYTALHHTHLLCRRKDPLDNATPSGNGVAAMVLLRLALLTGVADYREKANELLRGARVFLEKAPMAMSSTILALDWLLHPPLEIAIVGDMSSPEGKRLLRAVHRQFLPRRILASSPAPVPPGVAELVPFLQGKASLLDRPTAYVCKDSTCQAPVTREAELARLLAAG